jgi:predicted RNA binding protein YcfA (HicA-like mRNA interferase family)
MNMHTVHNLVKKLENNGIVIRRAGGTHLMARNPKTGKTYTISMKRINRLGTDKEFEHASKILLKSAA